jgi:transposase
LPAPACRWPSSTRPRQIRDFARATSLLAKTDTLDARVIAQFAEAIRPTIGAAPRAIPGRSR